MIVMIAFSTFSTLPFSLRWVGTITLAFASLAFASFAFASLAFASLEYPCYSLLFLELIAPTVPAEEILFFWRVYHILGWNYRWEPPFHAIIKITKIG